MLSVLKVIENENDAMLKSHLFVWFYQFAFFICCLCGAYLTVIRMHSCSSQKHLKIKEGRKEAKQNQMKMNGKENENCNNRLQKDSLHLKRIVSRNCPLITGDDLLGLCKPVSYFMKNAHHYQTGMASHFQVNN